MYTPGQCCARRTTRTQHYGTAVHFAWLSFTCLFLIKKKKKIVSHLCTLISLSRKKYVTNTLANVCNAAGGGIREPHTTMKHIRLSTRIPNERFCFEIVNRKSRLVPSSG